MDDMVRQQIERRRQRGEEDLARIANVGGHPVYSAFEVDSRSGQRYRVTIRDLRERRNTCTCPDYRTNLVGTCKHIEGVLAELHRTYRDALDELADARPPSTPIYLHYERAVTVRVGPPEPRSGRVQEILARAFDDDGVLPGPVLYTLPSLLRELDGLPERHRSEVSVDEEVRDYLGVLRDRESARRQRAWFEEQVRAGRRSLDLLASPLYGFQEDGALHLAFGRRALLADDMGLGKTVQTIAAVALLHQLRDIRSVLVICPASLKRQWAREVERFTTFETQVIEGPPERRREMYGRPAFLNIANYELVLRDEDAIGALRPDVIVLDEAQRIKNWRSKTADTVKRLESPYAFVLTGTPLENRLDELYSVFQFLDPRILGPLWQFNERYFDIEETRRGNVRVLGYRNLEELRGRIGPHVLRRTRREVLDSLPDRTDNHYFVEMTAEQTRVYDEFQSTVARLLATAKRRALSPKEHKVLLGALVKMRLVCNALALHDHGLDERARDRTAPKLRELRELLSDLVLHGDRKALVFSQWAGMLALVEPVLARLGLGYVKLTGAVPAARRGGLIERFFGEDDCRVFLSTDAGGVGLNLQAASLVINLDLPWNPATLDQRIGRAHRHGQSRAVQVVNLIARGTIEERMLDTLATKRSVFRGVFDAEAPDEVAFEDTGQAFLRSLAEMLSSDADRPAREFSVVPVGEAAVGGKRADVPPPDPAPLPAAAASPPDEPTETPLDAFAQALVAHYPGRVLLVRPTPGSRGQAAGVLVVVDRGPGRLRRAFERLLQDIWPDDPPQLRLMDREGYAVLTSLVRGGAAALETGDDAFKAPALAGDAVDEEAERRRLVMDGLDAAERRLRFAEVAVAGGFPEESARPVREALGLALNAVLTLARKRDRARPTTTDLPSARLVQARLVDAGLVAEDLAARLSHVRELTDADADDGADGESSGLSRSAAEGAVRTVRDLIDAGRALALAPPTAGA